VRPAEICRAGLRTRGRALRLPLSSDGSLSAKCSRRAAEKSSHSSTYDVRPPADLSMRRTDQRGSFGGNPTRREELPVHREPVHFHAGILPNTSPSRPACVAEAGTLPTVSQSELMSMNRFARFGRALAVGTVAAAAMLSTTQVASAAQEGPTVPDLITVPAGKKVSWSATRQASRSTRATTASGVRRPLPERRWSTTMARSSPLTSAGRPGRPGTAAPSWEHV
jgi:hypothetical protein